MSDAPRSGIGMAANKLAVTKIADRNIVVPDFPFAHSNPAALISFRATARFRKRQTRFQDFQIAATGSHAASVVQIRS
jgi:hypothetical protein